MAKLKSDPVTVTDLDEYLSNLSDFAFEVSALNALTGMGFQCEHGGSYVDPFTQKPREFDLRAVKALREKKKAEAAGGPAEPQ